MRFSLSVAATLAALLSAGPAVAQTASIAGPLGLSVRTYPTSAAAEKACAAPAAAWVYSSSGGAPSSYVFKNSPLAGTGKGAWVCLSDAIVDGFNPTCAANDPVVWMDAASKKYWTAGSSGYKSKADGTGGFMCLSTTVWLNLGQGASAGTSFEALGRPDLVKGCAKPNYVVWASVDNKNYVPLDDAAAGKGKGGYACNDVVKAAGYASYLTGAATPDALKCTAPAVAVWFNKNEQNYFMPGTDGYKAKVGSGTFVCSNDAQDLGLTNASGGFIGKFSAADLKCSPDKPMYSPHGSGKVYAQHDPVSPTAPVADGVGLWVCGNYANQHGLMPAMTSWKSPAEAKCPADTVVLVTGNTYAEKDWYDWQDSGGKYTCELIAKDLGYSAGGQNKRVVQSWPVHNQYTTDVACKKVGDQAAFIVQGGPALVHSSLAYGDPLAGRFGPGDWVCSKDAIAQGYPRVKSMHASADEANAACGGNVDFVPARGYTISGNQYWDYTQSVGYLSPKQVGYGKGSGFYICDSVAKADIGILASHAPLIGAAPTICGDNQRAANAIWLNMRDGSQCIADADAITSIVATGVPPTAYVITFGGKTQTINVADVVTAGGFFNGQPVFGQAHFGFANGVTRMTVAPLSDLWNQYRKLNGK